MPKTVSSSEAQNAFGAMIQWAKDKKDEVIIERRGKPAAALISYEAYEELETLRRLQKRLQALEKVKAVRQRVQERLPAIDEKEAYQQAGMGEEAIDRLMEHDRHVAEAAE